MSWDRGVGSCLVQKANGYPCGRQIQEGEPIRTVVVGMNAIVGHKRCVEEYEARKQQEKTGMVKKYQQQGPGGPMDTSNPQEMVMGSIPLEQQPGKPAEQAELPNLADMRMPEGVRPISEVPFEEEQAFAYQPPQPERSADLPTIGPDSTTPTHGNISGERLTVQEREVIAAFRAGQMPAETPESKDHRDRKTALLHELDNRFTYHAPSLEQGAKFPMLRGVARDMAHLIVDLCPDSRERSAALTHLDEVVMFANAAIARHS